MSGRGRGKRHGDGRDGGDGRNRKRRKVDNSDSISLAQISAIVDIHFKLTLAGKGDVSLMDYLAAKWNVFKRNKHFLHAADIYVDSSPIAVKSNKIMVSEIPADSTVHLQVHMKEFLSCNPSQALHNVAYSVTLTVTDALRSESGDVTPSILWFLKQGFRDVIGGNNKILAALSSGLILVNKSPCSDARTIINAGDVIEVAITASSTGMLRIPISEKEAHKFEVLHDTEDLGVIWKPSELHVDDTEPSIIPSLPFNLSPSTANAVVVPLLPMQPISDVFHALAGLVAIAKTEAAKRAYVIRETWTAVVIGRVEETLRLNDPPVINGHAAFTDVTPISKPFRSKRASWLTLVSLSSDIDVQHRQFIIQAETAGIPIVGCGDAQNNMFAGKGRFLALTGMSIRKAVDSAGGSVKEDCGEASSDDLVAPITTIKHDYPTKFDTLMEREAAVWVRDVKDRAVAELGDDETEDNLRRAMAGEPLAYIKGFAMFCLKFSVNSHVMIPRSASEVIVTTALEAFKKDAVFNGLIDSGHRINVLDLGTGSGCLLLSMLQSLGGNAHGVGLDISEEALQVARLNSKELGLEDRAAFILGDFGKLADIVDSLAIHGPFHVILCNPPYKASGGTRGLDVSIAEYEPAAAFFTGCAGLESYINLQRSLATIMTPSTPRGACIHSRALLCMELGPVQGDKVAFNIFKPSLASDGGTHAGPTWSFVQFADDSADCQRCVLLQATELDAAVTSIDA